MIELEKRMFKTLVVTPREGEGSSTLHTQPGSSAPYH
jgi:hypothetical protein